MSMSINFTHFSGNLVSSWVSNDRITFNGVHDHHVHVHDHHVHVHKLHTLFWQPCEQLGGTVVLAPCGTLVLGLFSHVAGEPCGTVSQHVVGTEVHSRIQHQQRAQQISCGNLQRFQC